MLDQWWGVVEELWRCWQGERWISVTYKKCNKKEKDAKYLAVKRSATNSGVKEKKRKEEAWEYWYEKIWWRT